MHVCVLQPIISSFLRALASRIHFLSTFSQRHPDSKACWLQIQSLASIWHSSSLREEVVMLSEDATVTWNCCR